VVRAATINRDTNGDQTMIEIMAEMAQTAAPIAVPTTVQTYGPVAAILIAMGGWKG
jgi:hypothetical protein